MSIWNMTGADLSAALAQPAPAPQAVAYPGASANLQPILESIANLSRRDQAALMRAFRKAEQTDKPKRIGGSSFKNWDDFTPALTAARTKAALADPDWYRNPDLSIWARLPSAWVSCKVFGGSSKSPRDMKLPQAQFWLGGTLPTGPEYAEWYAIDPASDVRNQHERAAERTKARALLDTLTANTPQAPAFALEHTPEDIDTLESV